MKTTFETETAPPVKKTLTSGLLILTMLSPIALLFASLISGLLLPALTVLFNLGIYPIVWIATAVATLLAPFPPLLIVIGTTLLSIAASCLLAGLIGGLLIGTGLRIVNYVYDMLKELLSSWIENSTVTDMVIPAILIPAIFLSGIILGAPLMGMACYGIFFPIFLAAISSLPALPMILLITGIGLLGGASLLLGGTAGLALAGNAQIAPDSQKNEPEACTPASEEQTTEIPKVSQGLKNLGTAMKSAESADAPCDTVKIFAEQSKKKEETGNSLPLEDAALSM
jgi:hypothetical protein